MNNDRDFDRAVDHWLDEGSDATPPEVIDGVLLAVRSTSQERDLRIPWRTTSMKRLAYAVAAVAAVAVGVTALSALTPRIGSEPTPTEDPSGDLGIFERVAGWIVYEDGNGIWGVDPASPADQATTVQLTSEAGTPLAWSSDGTRLLIMRGSPGGQHLFVLHADGSETQVTTDPMLIRGATFSPDGSGVMFAATTDSPEAECCANFALYAVEADGGPVETLVEARTGNLEELTFAPDGTQIAYVDGAGDHGHSVWVMNVDGSDAHQILANETTAGGHVHGLAWSHAGDRIALGLEGNIYTFATDGSDFSRVIIGGGEPFWSTDGSRIAYSRPCTTGCGLAIADADGSNGLTLGRGTSGPWHPGTPSHSVEPTTTPSPTAVASFSEAVTDSLNGFLEARVAGEGAQQYLDDQFASEEDIPLLYATTSGSPYDQAEFEPVRDIGWPYGFMAFKVRLFAGDTVVEQLFFMPQDLALYPDPARAADARLRLEYVQDGFGTDIAPTTEDGQPVAAPYTAFDGEVTLRVAHPWVFRGPGGSLRLIPDGPGVPPTSDGGERNDWDLFVLVADPDGCHGPLTGTAAHDAAALAEIIRSDPDLEATAPVAVTAGGAEALMMDVAITTAGTIFCNRGDGVAALEVDPGVRDRMRLYLFDGDDPGGATMRILAMAIIAPESHFERAVAAAAPVVDSVEFHVP
jgi:hypothetical protein